MNIMALIRRIAGAGATLACILVLGTAADAQVAITINGQAVNVSPEPIIQDGRVFVPLRGVFENLGATVVYSNGQIDATGNGREISLQIGSTQATVNGSAETIDVAPFIVGASTYVPLRFVSQALGASVSWDNNDRVVSISLAGAPQTYNAQTPVPYNDNSYNGNAYNGNGYNGNAYNDTQAYEENDDFVNEPPPPIPFYEQPPVPAPNLIWMPGYWAWGGAGYYWVPGTWVQAPQPQYVWTPGYWGFHDGYFGWHRGYWATQVGFYGGVNYGAGYYGRGYGGGHWQGNTYRYNTAVTHVTNVTIIRNVYIDRTVIVNHTTINNISYNGGPRGIAARPTTTELIVARAPHVGLTTLQQQHIRVASQDRALLATVNAGKPPITVAPKPFTPIARPIGFVPITTTDRAAAAKLVVHPAGPRPTEFPTTVPRPAIAPPAPPRLVRPETGGAFMVTPRPLRTMVERPTQTPAITRPVRPRTMVERPTLTPTPRPSLSATPRPLPIRPTYPPPPVVRPLPERPALVSPRPAPILTPRPAAVLTPRPLPVRPTYPPPPVLRPQLERPAVVPTRPAPIVIPRPAPTQTQRPLPVRNIYPVQPVRPTTPNPPVRPQIVHPPVAKTPMPPPHVVHTPVAKPKPTEPAPH